MGESKTKKGVVLPLYENDEGGIRGLHIGEDGVTAHEWHPVQEGQPTRGQTVTTMQKRSCGHLHAETTIVGPDTTASGRRPSTGLRPKQGVFMGEWNETCALSHLPIMFGDPCRLLLLVKSPDYGDQAVGYLEGFGIWTPWVLPLLGHYNGYGEVGVEPSWRTQFIQQRIVEAIHERDEGDSPRELAVRRADLMAEGWLEHLQDLIGNGRAQVIADPIMNDPDPQVLGRCILREDVYQALLSPAENRDGTHTVEGELARELVRYEQVVKAPSLDEIGANMEQLEGTDFAESVSGLLDSMKTYRRQAAVISSYGPAGYEGIGAYHVYLHDRLTKGESITDDEPSTVLRELVEFRQVITHMEMMRRLWMPQAGRGSQSLNWNSYITWAKAIFDVATQAEQTEHTV